MPETNLPDRHESPEERMQRRRARRWKRRARIVAPFLGVSALLATLAISVDLIEYQPQPAKKRLSDRPLPAAVTEPRAAQAIPLRASVSTASVVTPEPLVGSQPLDVRLMPGGDEASAQPDRDFAPPRRPYALRDQR
jgi:hypothetical protein